MLHTCLHCARRLASPLQAPCSCSHFYLRSYDLPLPESLAASRSSASHIPKTLVSSQGKAGRQLRAGKDTNFSALLPHALIGLGPSQCNSPFIAYPPQRHMFLSSLSQTAAEQLPWLAYLPFFPNSN